MDGRSHLIQLKEWFVFERIRFRVMALAVVAFAAPIEAQLVPTTSVNNKGGTFVVEVNGQKLTLPVTVLIDPDTGQPYKSAGASSDATQADPGLDATKARAVQGVTGGKPVSITATQLPVQGTQAVGATLTTNPLVGGYSRTSNGVLRYFSGDNAGSAVGVVSGLDTRAFGHVYDGTNWQPAAGSTTGSFVVGKGGSSLATGQISVGTTATLIAAARTGRQKIGVTVTTAVQCAFGNSGVTLATGWPLAAVAYASDSWDTAVALYAVCASAATVGYREQY